MTNSPDPHPTRIPGYEGGPLTHRPELLEEPLFWLGHLASCVHGEEDAELLFGADYDAADEFQGELWEKAEWPAFTLPLPAGHRLHVVYRTFEDDAGVDYLLHHPDWDRAELLACDDGHFRGPALSWSELVGAADGALPGGSTTDAHARLLLLLPAFGDDEVPEDAPDRLAEALRALTGVEDPQALAVVLLEGQGAPGPVHWTTTPQGPKVNNGDHSPRNPTHPAALSPTSQSRVTTALTPEP
ncbi:hypothetical protein [Streptomyces sp. NPDC097619]|uniref:hypothetical protein n=1 Tax=Streptomyces sp. NPDC097619 TaxID=3157228 RepID=UPI003326E500